MVESVTDNLRQEQIERVASAIIASGFTSEEDDKGEDHPYNLPHALNEAESRALREFWQCNRIVCT